MTAEIAILNKSAVALAADSAVTISSGSDQQKIYDSADKLFELSLCDPIGVMVNGDMIFAGIPMGVLLKNHRATGTPFVTVPDAAKALLEYMSGLGQSSPTEVKRSYIYNGVRPFFERIKERVSAGFNSRLFSTEVPENGDFRDRFENLQNELLDEQIEVMTVFLTKIPDASFIGNIDTESSALEDEISYELGETIFETLTDAQRSGLRNVAHLALNKQGTGPTNTGIIVAGFGSADMFPTLVHYQVFGVVGGRLKYYQVELVDIDRDGISAKVIPFAQREMVERFLYGLDDSIRNNIAGFCRKSIPDIRKSITDRLDIDVEDLASLEKAAEEAEAVFIEGLTKDSFDVIRQTSETEIEEMVEFMPKPELGRMAEALVNLTSIKRRVSRGMETVGGPIDVAIISKAEGFVWIQRKHYFPAELNMRYFDRKR